MLDRVKRTPSKLDDLFVLALGFATFVPFVLRIIGIVDLSFEYFDVGVAVAALAFVLGRYVHWLIKRSTGVALPEPIVFLLGVMAVYHFVAIYQVTIVAENPLQANVWLLVVSYAISAVMLGRYLWVLEFLAFIAWMISELFRLVNAGNKARQESDVVAEPEEAPHLDRQEMPRVGEYQPPPQANHPPLPPMPNFAQDTVRHNAIPDANELLNASKNGDTNALNNLIQRLRGVQRDTLRQILVDGRVPPGVVDNKIFPVLYQNGDPALLLGVLTYQGFENQRSAFVAALEQ